MAHKQGIAVAVNGVVNASTAVSGCCHNLVQQNKKEGNDRLGLGCIGCERNAVPCCQWR